MATLLLARYAGQSPADCWRARERKRVTSGQYISAPDSFPQWEITIGRTEWFRAGADAHYVHVSTDDPSKIAYTPDERHGREDRQLRTKPGKYLRKYFAHVLPEAEITRLARNYLEANAQAELHFAETADEIEKCYRNGPRSCMSNSDSVRAYAGHGLKIAYIADKDGDATGRAVCWPEKLVFATIYGDSARLKGALLRAGYTSGDDRAFEGAQLACNEAEDGGYVCPWLDTSPCSVSVAHADGVQVLRITRNGDFEAQETSGVIGGVACERCGDCASGEDTHYVAEQTWCNSCYESYGFWCENCEEAYDTDDSREVHPDPHEAARNQYTQLMCSFCAEDNATECEECDKLTVNEGCVEVAGTDLCNGCAEGRVYVCEHCETDCDNKQSTPREITPEGSGHYETWCNSCASEAHSCPEHCGEGFESEGDAKACCA